MVSEVAATEAVDLEVDSEVEHAEASAVHSVAMVVACKVDISKQIMLRMQVVTRSCQTYQTRGHDETEATISQLSRTTSGVEIGGA